MSNVSDRRIRSVALKEDEKVFLIGDLLKEQEANKSNPDFVSDLDELYVIGQGKGLPFEFIDDEVITVDEFEECVIVVRYAKLDGKLYPMLSTIVDSNKRGKDLEMPLAIFRRVPELLEDREWLTNGSPLNEKMIRASIADLYRLMIIAGHDLHIDAMKKCAKRDFETVNGKRVVVDVAALPDEKRKKFWCYRISIIEK